MGVDDRSRQAQRARRARRRRRLRGGRRRVILRPRERRRPLGVHRARRARRDDGVDDPEHAVPAEPPRPRDARRPAGALGAELAARRRPATDRVYGSEAHAAACASARPRRGPPDLPLREHADRARAARRATSSRGSRRSQIAGSEPSMFRRTSTEEKASDRRTDPRLGGRDRRSSVSAVRGRRSSPTSTATTSACRCSPSAPRSTTTPGVLRSRPVGAAGRAPVALSTGPGAARLWRRYTVLNIRFLWRLGLRSLGVRTPGCPGERSRSNR